MKVILSLAAMAALAASTAIDLTKRSSPLQVELKHVSDTKVRASITNTGSQGYNLFHAGSILDPSPVRKLQVHNASAHAPFAGILKRMSYNNPTDNDFTAIAPGQTIDADVDVAELYDVGSDTYDLTANGALPYAEAGSKKLSGKSLSFSSNKLSIAVDGVKASKVTKALDKLGISRRSEIQSDCTGDQLQAVQTANKNCARLARHASNTAANGHGQIFPEFFKTSSRPEIAENLRKVADECAADGAGQTTSYCTETSSQPVCTDNVLAYTTPSQMTISYCPLFFQYLPAVATQCTEQDQGTTTLHEMTHALDGTDDLGYGFSAATQLSASQAENNADSYALYANAIDLRCAANGGSSGGFGTNDNSASSSSSDSGSWWTWLTGGSK